MNILSQMYYLFRERAGTETTLMASVQKRRNGNSRGGGHIIIKDILTRFKDGWTKDTSCTGGESNIYFGRRIRDNYVFITAGASGLIMG